VEAYLANPSASSLGHRNLQSTAFKAKVAIAAIKGDRTLVQLAEQLNGSGSEAAIPNPSPHAQTFEGAAWHGSFGCSPMFNGH
jgi:hypothetical protein